MAIVGRMTYPHIRTTLSSPHLHTRPICLWMLPERLAWDRSDGSRERPGSIRGLVQLLVAERFESLCQGFLPPLNSSEYRFPLCPDQILDRDTRGAEIE